MDEIKIKSVLAKSIGLLLQYVHYDIHIAKIPLEMKIRHLVNRQIPILCDNFDEDDCS